MMMMTSLLFLLFCVASATARPHLRSLQQEQELPLTIHATVSPSPPAQQQDGDSRAAQCLISSFESLQTPSRDMEKDDIPLTLSIARSTFQVLGTSPPTQAPVKTMAPSSPPSSYQEQDDYLLAHDDDDAFRVEDEQEEEDALQTFLQNLANWVHAFLVKIHVMDPSSSITVSPASAPSEDDMSRAPAPAPSQDIACHLCPPDDDDFFGNGGIMIETPPPSAVVQEEEQEEDTSCGSLCPEDDDGDLAYPGADDQLQDDPLVIPFRGDGGDVRRLSTRTMWTFDSLLEGSGSSQDDLWASLDEANDRFWGKRFCDCFTTEAGEEDYLPTCQIHF